MPFRFSAMRGGHFQLNKSGWGGGGEGGYTSSSVQ